jgi:hypothetical protein
MDPEKMKRANATTMGVNYDIIACCLAHWYSRVTKTGFCSAPFHRNAYDVIQGLHSIGRGLLRHVAALAFLFLAMTGPRRGGILLLIL